MQNSKNVKGQVASLPRFAERGRGDKGQEKGVRLYALRMTHCLLLVTVLFCISSLVWAEEPGSKQKKKKYPHPHALHSEAKSERSTDFSVDEIIDWPGLLRTLQDRLNILPLSPEARMVISGFKPDALNSEDKTVTVNEINKLLIDEKLNSKVEKIVTFGSETKKLESDYRKTKSREDLKWLNRSIINDIFPKTPRIAKVKELKKITCATCHEAWGPKAWGVIEGMEVKEPYKAIIDEREVMECFSKAITGEKTMEECIEKVNMLKRARIEPYGPLKNFIQRSDPKGEIPFFVAIHPEDPYTFKPLLKKLVCLECHSSERKVDKVMGRDGKVKKIQVFYGAGSEKREHVPEEYYIRD